MKNQKTNIEANKPVRFNIPLDATREQLQNFIDELKRAAHAGEIPPDPRSKWFHGPSLLQQQPLPEDADKKEDTNGTTV
jgi:hypothetical protein